MSDYMALLTFCYFLWVVSMKICTTRSGTCWLNQELQHAMIIFLLAPVYHVPTKLKSNRYLSFETYPYWNIFDKFTIPSKVRNTSLRKGENKFIVWTKQTLFWRIFVWKICFLTTLELCLFTGSNWQLVRIGSSNGLAQIIVAEMLKDCLADMWHIGLQVLEDTKKLPC